VASSELRRAQSGVVPGVSNPESWINPQLGDSVGVGVGVADDMLDDVEVVEGSADEVLGDVEVVEDSVLESAELVEAAADVVLEGVEVEPEVMSFAPNTPVLDCASFASDFM